RPVHLVRGNRRHVDFQLVDVERYFADSLNGIGMKEHTAFLRDRADLRDRLDDANLVVGGHDRDEDGLVGDRVANVVDVYQSVFLDREIGYSTALFLEPLAGVDHRLVLGHTGDDVVTFLAIHVDHAFDGEVVRFRGAAGKDDLLRVGTNEIGHLLARF